MGAQAGGKADGGSEPSAPRAKSLARVLPALKAWASSLAVSRGDLGRDAVAGIPGAVGSVSDGMAASVLVGVNPIHGLYASFAGPIFGGLTSSTRLMVITTTSAAALAAGGRLFLSGVTPDLLTQFRRTEATESSAIAVFPEAEVVGESSSAAYATALKWRGQHTGNGAAQGKEET
jgi:hypothetical protein